ncbi:hypothetical protein DICVIV_10644 [Dictyocaulus viviparus]|uniref:Uncharacterized protein n=1 Tax=Dictyocaulus viviparus TaxID=29172 RepID=A0A0D8XHX4_DICVI|nr:hypothetical protein DICVIV_10644 [Dictyocaulus viviparus]
MAIVIFVLFYGTIEAMSKLPLPQNSTDPLKEKNSEEFYKLFQLPADIMTKLAADAGYIDTSYTTTSGPWIVRRILSNVEKQLKSKPDLSMKSIPQTIVKTNPANFIPVPIVQSATDMSYSNVKPQYVYQPIIQPDGKTYYQQFLILPGKVVSSGDADAVLRSSNDRSPFVQETLLDPKRIMQAEFSVTAPTFPPPVSTYQFSNIPPASSTVMTTSASPQAYHARFIKSHSSDAKMAFQQEAPHQLHAQHSDTSLSHDTSRKPVEEFSHQRRSLSINKLPRSDEEEANTHIYQEYVAIPPKTFMKMTQTSPLRIRTIESHFEHTRNAETGKIHQLKRDEMTRMSVEQHIEEDKHSQSPFRDQKLRKVRKLRKVKKNIRLNDREEEMIDSVSEQHHKDVRKMPQTRYLERLPIAVPSKKQERTLASKTWKRKTHEPIDLLMSKDLESFEQKKDSEDEVTDVQMKKEKEQAEELQIQRNCKIYVELTFP